MRLKRRDIFRALVAPALLGSFRINGAFAGGSRLPLTPACDDHPEITQQQIAGPFYKPKSPLRADLSEPGDNAQRLRLSGRVLSSRCKPMSGALLEVWHADAKGEYDLKGFRHRGHVFADDAGHFAITTIMPGIYEGRTRHLHVRVQGANGPVLTTQLYFPDEPENAGDGLFQRSLLIKPTSRDGVYDATFDFVVRA